MIPLSTNAAAMLYLCLTLSTLFGFWLNHHYRARKRKIVLVEEKLHVCEYCRYAYLKKLSKKISQCPQCQSFNE